jgi:hypothetical protein
MPNDVPPPIPRDPPREFDVRSLNAKLNAQKPWTRLYTVGMVAFAVGLLAVALVFWARSGFTVLASPRWLFLVVVTAVFATLIIRVSYRSRAVDYPTAEAIVIRPDGIDVRYPRTGIRTLRWTDDRMSFELLEYDWAVLQALRSISPTRFTLISDGRPTIIDESAFRAILNEASSRGLTRPKTPGPLTVGNPKITLVQGRSVS